jgi:hypothetical protein
VKDVLAPEKPSAIVVMLGTNDRLPLRDRAPPPKSATPTPQGQGGTTPATPPAAEATPPDADQPPAANEAQRRPPPPGGNYEFHTDKWAELYAKRIDEMIAALKSKGVPVLWVGLPAIRGTKSTSDMLYLDELYRARAEKAGIVYVDIWDGFVDDQGRYAQQGPDFQGQTRRLRTYDGVNFTKSGAEKLAHYVEHELRRVLTSHVVPVALPGPEEQAPAKSGGSGAKPAIGPVVPLSAIGSGEGGELLGGGRSAQKETDPLATRVLSHGEALAAPPGRADDFSWPRTDAKANADSVPDAAPPPAAPPAPGSPAAPKGAAGKNETNKTDANKTDASKTDASKNEAKKASEAKKEPAAPAVAPPKPRQPRFELDGAPPRPPLPVGPAAANSR